MGWTTASSIAGIIALAISIVNLAINIWNNQIRFDLRIENVEQVPISGNKVIIVTMTIVNKSSKTLNVTRINLKNPDGKWLECRLRKMLLMDRTWPIMREGSDARKEAVFSTEFPVNIAASGSEHIVATFRDTIDSKSFEGEEEIELNVSTGIGEVRKTDKHRTCVDKNDLLWIY